MAVAVAVKATGVTLRRSAGARARKRQVLCESCLVDLQTSAAPRKASGL